MNTEIRIIKTYGLRRGYAVISQEMTKDFYVIGEARKWAKQESKRTGLKVKDETR